MTSKIPPVSSSKKIFAVAVEYGEMIHKPILNKHDDNNSIFKALKTLSEIIFFMKTYKILIALRHEGDKKSLIKNFLP